MPQGVPLRSQPNSRPMHSRPGPQGVGLVGSHHSSAPQPPRALCVPPLQPGLLQTRVQAAGAATRLVFHALFATGSPKQTASSRFCSRTVQAPAKPKPLRNHSMASKPWMVRLAVANDRKPPTRGMGCLTPEMVALDEGLNRSASANPTTLVEPWLTPASGPVPPAAQPLASVRPLGQPSGHPPGQPVDAPGLALPVAPGIAVARPPGGP